MSGELVGELIEARKGPIASLPRSEFIFLVTVAARCDAHTRQGFCASDEIAHAVGGQKLGTPASKETVKRLRRYLRAKGLIVVLKSGFTTHGKTYATVYRMPVFSDYVGVTIDDPYISGEHDLEGSSGDLEGSSGDLEGSSDGLVGVTQDDPPTSFATSVSTSINNEKASRGIKSDSASDVGIIDVGGKAMKVIYSCATPGCDRPLDPWKFIGNREYCNECYDRLRNRR